MENGEITIHSRALFDGKSTGPDDAPIIVADLLKTPENIGSLIRMAANIGIKRIVSIETEPHRESKIRKTACMAWDYVELIHATKDNYSDFIPDDYKLVALETSSISQNIYKAELPRKMALVVGNEVDGVRLDLLNDCPLHVHIPMTGPATSMNVSHATCVALFEWVRRFAV